MTTRFPDGFLWGASTAAYQVEGGNTGSALHAWEKGQGWEPCGSAAGSWEMWPDDIRCLQALGLNAYRFSVEWSRVEPHPGEFDEAAIGRYREMAASLRKAGIRPIVCLHHFSEPAWLFERFPDGWLTSGPALAFTGFVDRIVPELRTDVHDWLTFNEPMVWLLFAYAIGHFPPGKRRALSLERTFYKGGLLESVLSAHREAYKLIHRYDPEARVSIAQNVADLEPAHAGRADLEALRAWDLFMHRKFLDLAHSWGTLDFLGLNYYTRIFVSASRLPCMPFGALPAYGEVEALLGSRLFRLLGGRRGGRPLTDMGWEVVPEGLGRVVRRLWEAYKLPVLVTENGLADSTGERRDGFIREHLESLARAGADGVPLLGYLHWSLIDNYEWGSFKPKFGLFSVDREHGHKRTPAPGAKLYAEIVKNNSV